MNYFNQKVKNVVAKKPSYLLSQRDKKGRHNRAITLCEIAFDFYRGNIKCLLQTLNFEFCW